MHYAQVMLTEAAVVHSMLVELDPRFVVCHDYDLMLSASQAARVSSFSAPSGPVAAMLERSLLATATPHEGKRNDALKFAHAGSIVERLQKKMDALEATLCPPTGD